MAESEYAKGERKFQDLPLKTRGILWEQIPDCRPALLALEEDARADDATVGPYQYILEVSSTILERALISHNEEELKRFFDACEALLAHGNDYLAEIVEDLVAKDVIRRWRQEIKYVGPLLRQIILDRQQPSGE
ncbi:DUF7674 family protein [Nonomuraea sp. NPDC004354]